MEVTTKDNNELTNYFKLEISRTNTMEKEISIPEYYANHGLLINFLLRPVILSMVGKIVLEVFYRGFWVALSYFR